MSEQQIERKEEKGDNKVQEQDITNQSDLIQKKEVEQQIDLSDEQVTTLKDMVKVIRTDIKNNKRKCMLIDLICYSASLVLSDKQYKDILKKQKSSNINSKIAEFFKSDNLRKEFINVLTQQICIRADLPHYIIIFGNEIDQTVKFSKYTLLQVKITNPYLITLFEVPYIAINSLKAESKLLNSMISPNENKQDGQQLINLFNLINVEVLDQYTTNGLTTLAFKDEFINALKDTIKFYLVQMSLSPDKQDEKRLNMLSSLILSRVIQKIAKFKDDPKTKSIGTEFHWNVILGAFDQASSRESSIYSSHQVLLNHKKTQILYYQKMQCLFTTQTGHPKKCECIIYCQRVDNKMANYSQIVERVRENIINIETIYYFAFFILMLSFIYGGKVCSRLNNDLEENKVERSLRIAAGLEKKTYIEQYCGMQNQLTLNAGALFLVFAAFRQFYNKYNKKKEQMQRK